jgi:probable HAF family extracellular repeat protein
MSRRRLSLLSVILLGLVLAGPSLALAVSYNFTTISVPGASYTVAQGINDAGRVVGFTNAQGFLSHPGGSLTTFDFPGADATGAYGINRSSEIVGSADSGPLTQGFLTDTSVSFFGTVVVPGASYTVPQGNNDAGQVVGFIGDSSGGVHGFLQNRDGSSIWIDFPGALYSDAYGVNNFGQIVGGFDDANLVTHGYLLDTNGSFTQIDFPGAIFTQLRGINAGQIVGRFRDAAGVMHGFLLDTYGFTQIDVPGASSTGIRGINNLGQIVGDFDGGGFVGTPN